LRRAAIDEDGRGEAFEGCLVREDPDLSGPALDLLLDGALYGIGGTHAPPVTLREAEDGQPFRNSLFEPPGELAGRRAAGAVQRAPSA